MDIGSLLLLLALVIAVGAFIASPLRWKKAPKPLGERELTLSQLLAERERILDALTELDFDNVMGKVPEDLYPLQREALLKRGADVLRLLDEMQPEAKELEEEDFLESMIAARRKEEKPGSKAEKLESKAETPTGETNYCPACGAEIIAGDQFCASCGKAL